MEKKHKIRGIAGTIVFHVLLALLLVLFAFKTPLPLPEEMAVEIDMGGGGGGQTGDMSESSQDQSSDQKSPDNSQNSSYENFVTQNDPSEITASNVDANPVVRNEQVIDQRISEFWNSKQNSKNGGYGKEKDAGTGTGTGTGTGKGTGDGSGTGTGTGQGSGPNFSLHGRSAKYIPIPDYTEQDQGKVVVDIWVDKNGNVTKAIAGARGTTTSNPSLWRKAQQAALSAKFSVNHDAPEEQKGTITYNFIRLGN